MADFLSFTILPCLLFTLLLLFVLLYLGRTIEGSIPSHSSFTASAIGAETHFLCLCRMQQLAKRDGSILLIDVRYKYPASRSGRMSLRPSGFLWPRIVSISTRGAWADCVSRHSADCRRVFSEKEIPP